MSSNFNVVNFHLTENCNYRCTYCFAKFNNTSEMTLDGWKKAADIVNGYFKRNGILNGRINLAGGEPLLVKFLNPLIDYIHSIGIDVSIITNGSFLTIHHIEQWIGKVNILGISVDSINKDTNMRIGRNQGSKVLDIPYLIEVLSYAKSMGMNLKVNTVVSRLNINENLIELYKKVDFDRIKFLQMRVNQNCNDQAKELSITNEEFMVYSTQIQKVISNIVIEPDTDLDSSYVIIDPYGNLIANHMNVHTKTGSIFDSKLEELIEKAKLSFDTFNKRYIKHGGVL